jgi:hypothetical protein
MLSDEERPAMVPFLGRAIGLVVPAPEHPTGRVGFFPRLRRQDGDDPAVARTAELRRSVADRFLSAVEVTSTHPRWSWYARHTRVSRLFWDLMNEPASPATPDAYAERLVARLDLLHGCYEEAMAALELPRALPAVPDRVADRTGAGRAAEELRS